MLNDVKPLSGKPVQIVASGGDYRLLLHGGGLYQFYNKATDQAANMPESSARYLIEHMARNGINNDEAVENYLKLHAQSASVQLTELAVRPHTLDEHTKLGVANVINRAAAEQAATEIADVDGDHRILATDSIGFFFEWLDQGHAVFHDMDNDIMVVGVRDFIRAMEERFGPMWHSYQASKAAHQVAEPRPVAEPACHGGPEILGAEPIREEPPVVIEYAEQKDGAWTITRLPLAVLPNGVRDLLDPEPINRTEPGRRISTFQENANGQDGI